MTEKHAIADSIPSIEELKTLPHETVRVQAIYLRKKIEAMFQNINDLVKKLYEKDKVIVHLNSQLNQLNAMKIANEDLYKSTLKQVNESNQAYLEEIKKLNALIKKMENNGRVG